MEAFVSRLIQVISADNFEFKVIAKEPIQPQTVIEISPTLSISGRTAIAMSKASQIFQRRIIIDQAQVDKEYRIFAELGEMELEKRLNSGQITSEDYQTILASKVNFNLLLDAKTHLISMGYSLIYGHSEYPNVVREYDSFSKLCIFRTVKYIQPGEELTYYT
jgi:hypothetical protein